jgi:putative transposase
MARVVVPGYPHHVTQRGNRRQKIFFCDEDYKRYIKLMSKYTKKAGTEVWAYCLMPNHVHLVMVPGKEDGLRAALGEAHRRYTCFVNIREGWSGHLWQERFHSFTMEESYLLATVRYVERNPVAAGLCEFPGQWKWSSAQAHLKEENDDLVNVRPMLDRIDDWHQYLSDCCLHLEENKLIERHTQTGRPLGGDKFINSLEALTGKSLAPKKRGRKPGKNYKE